MSVQPRETGEVSWLAWVRTLDGLTATELLVLRELALLVDEYGVAIVSMGHLVETCGRARRSVFRAVADLEKKGFLRRERRRQGQRQAASLIQLRREAGDARGERVVPIPVGSRIHDSSWAETTLGDLVENGPFREALIQAAREQWQGQASSAIAQCLLLNGPRQFWMALTRVRRFMGLSEADARDHVIGLAWEACQTEFDRIVSASKPWAMLTVILARTVSDLDTPLVDPVDPGTFPEDGVRPGQGVSFGRSERTLPRGGQTPVFVSVRDLPEPIERLIVALVDAGMDETVARAATRRVVEIAADVDPSRRHTYAARDVRLADLGVGGDTARAWMTLLAGSRRGTRPGALTADPDELRTGVLEVVRLWHRNMGVRDATSA